MASLRFHRAGKYLIPVVLIVYVLIAGTNLVFGFRAHEIFPFFAWTLFSHTPERIKLQPAMLLHTIDGEPAAGPRYVLPDASGGHRASLQRVFRECGFLQDRTGAQPRRADRCEALVQRIVFPIVEWIAAGPRVDFSIVLLRIDLRDVQADLDRIAAGEAAPADHYRLDRLLGRWTTAHL